jgi:hypothetical protein
VREAMGKRRAQEVDATEEKGEIVEESRVVEESVQCNAVPERSPHSPPRCPCTARVSGTLTAACTPRGTPFDPHMG